MSETLAASPNIQQEQALQAREVALRQLLPVDYDFAKESGLIDMFYYDPETGDDGLLHTLSGIVKTGEAGAFVAEGFHHGPSGELMSPVVSDAAGNSLPDTRTISNDPATENNDERAQLRHFPLEPFRSRVVINGLVKYGVTTDPKTGEKKLQAAKNSMFPDEYDALAVMQAVRSAYNNRDREKDVPAHGTHGDVLLTTGSATLMDGKSTMPIRMVLDAKNGKVVTALPLLRKRPPGFMKLSPEEVADVMTYGLAK